MTWLRALLYSIGPALLVGPLSGLGGGLIMLAVMLASVGSSDAPPIVAMLTLLVSLAGGLFVSTPTCSVFGMIMLKLAVARAEWLTGKRWALAGLVIGMGMGGFVGLLLLAESGGAPDAFLAAAVLTLSASALGASSSLLMWRMLRGRVSKLNTVDSSVFE